MATKSTIDSLKARITKADTEAQAIKSEIHAKQLKDYQANLNKNLRDTRKRQRGWSVPSDPERDMNANDRRKAMANVRQKVEESPLMQALISRTVDSVVSSGFRLSMNTADTGYNKEVEDRWAIESDKLDIRGVRTWGEMQRMWFSRYGIDGDVGINMVDGGMTEDNVALSYVQTIEADRISRQIGGTDDGITMDRFGKPIKYYISRRKAVGTADKGKDKAKAIHASNFILYAHFPHDRADRKRGVSKYLQCLNVIADFEEMLDAMVQTVKNEAFMGIKFTVTPGPDGSIFGSQMEELKKSEDGATRRHVKMVSGLNLNLEPDEDAEIMEKKNPNGGFFEFYSLLIRYMGAATGMPLELIMFDLGNLNYSSARAMMELAKRGFTVDQKKLGNVSSRIFQWWLSREIKYNKLKVPDEVKTPWRHQWVYPAWPYLDPLKEVQANGLSLDRGFTTLQKILLESSGMDLEDILLQRKKEVELFRQYNIPMVTGQPGTSIMQDDEKDGE